MPRALKVMRILTAIATGVMALLLCWQCIDIYTDGISAANASGNALTEIYSMEDVLLRLGQLALPAVIYVGLIAGTAVLQMVYPAAKSKPSARRFGKVNVSSASAEVKHIWLKRMIIAILASLFIVLGVINGGLYDVLVKAINICTECIGLG